MEPAVPTQYCGSWTGVLANDHGSESTFHTLHRPLAADVAMANRAAAEAAGMAARELSKELGGVNTQRNRPLARTIDTTRARHSAYGVERLCL
jgi:hypothetical protein